MECMGLFFLDFVNALPCMNEYERVRLCTRLPAFDRDHTKILHLIQTPAVTKGCLMEVRGAHYPLT